MDVRAYGRSTRPPKMAQPPADNPPIGSYDTFVSDIGSVVDAIRSRQNVAKISFVGWSLGAGMMAAYTTHANDKVARLVMFAPGWLPTEKPDAAQWPKLGSYLVNTKDESDYDSIPAERRNEIYPRAWFEA
jgi:pimeloyl-ACP methyl ester carboxylesterase